jgi:hypothetical protein
MKGKQFLIVILLFILLLIGISVFLFKTRYDKTVQTREMENSVRDATRFGTNPGTSEGQIQKSSIEETPVEQSIMLDVISPADQTQVINPSINVRGKTVPGAEVFVNEKEVIAGTDGVFQVLYTLEEGENPILVVASDADGNVAEEELTIVYTAEES